LAGTLALILTFSPGEKERLLHVSVLLAVCPANTVADFSKTRRNILLLLGEKAGMREVVKFILRRKRNLHAARALYNVLL
jgi:3-deoxy-D-manno-octulosonate 8-phosphate phosphatase KdsC-like HAD superfamily phosphatase